MTKIKNIENNNYIKNIILTIILIY